MPDFYFEKKLWREGFKFVAGADEVGRGSFAGPVVASCVALAPMSNYQFPISNEKGDTIFINDSKKLTSLQRFKAAKWIKKHCATYGIGESSVSEINRLGLSKATQKAFRRAVISANKRFKKRIDYLLLDAIYIPYLRNYPVGRKNAKQLPILRGDEKSFSIAASSIIAKVYRDMLMKKLSENYPEYRWSGNKGYGTKEHREAILEYGPTKHHRTKFIETSLNKSFSSPIQ